MRLQIDTSTGVPITRQVMDQVRGLCASGSLKPGDRLPSVRELARQLTVNQNTILRVYERLTVEGVLDRRHGDGTYVADRLPRGQYKAERQSLREELVRIARRARVLEIEPEELQKLLEKAVTEDRATLSRQAEARS